MLPCPDSFWRNWHEEAVEDPDLQASLRSVATRCDELSQTLTRRRHSKKQVFDFVSTRGERANLIVAVPCYSIVVESGSLTPATYVGQSRCSLRVDQNGYERFYIIDANLKVTVRLSGHGNLVSCSIPFKVSADLLDSFRKRYLTVDRDLNFIIAPSQRTPRRVHDLFRRSKTKATAASLHEAAQPWGADITTDFGWDDKFHTWLEALLAEHAVPEKAAARESMLASLEGALEVALVPTDDHKCVVELVDSLASPAMGL